MPVTNPKIVKKHAFVSGVMIHLNEKIYTRLLSKEVMLNKETAFSKFTEKEMDERMKENMRLEYLDLYKLTYEKDNKNPHF